MKQLNRKKGNIGEKYAAEYLVKNNFEIITQNYSDRFGEIDIIASKNNVLSFVEVKAKTGNDFGTPEQMITRAKVRQIQRMAEVFLTKNKKLSDKFNVTRIDVVAIVLLDNGELDRLDYYENVGAEF